MDILQRQDRCILMAGLADILLRQDESKKQFGREKFDLNALKSFKNLVGQRNYLNKTAMLVGVGSSRIVYAITAKHVIKLAGGQRLLANPNDTMRVEAGIAQNMAEVEGYAAASPAVKLILPRTVDIPGNGGDWIISELVRPLTSYEELTALTIGDSMIIDADGVVYDIKQLLKLFSKYEEETIDSIAASSPEPVSRFVNSLTLAIDELGLGQGDIVRIAQWGKTADGRAVLLDFGGTEDVLDEYY